MYKGEISIKHEQLESIMQVAESLGMRGLMDVACQPTQTKTSPEPGQHAVPPALIPTSVNKPECCGSCSGYTPSKKRRLYEDPASNEKPLQCSRTPGPDSRTVRTPTGSGIDNRMPPASMVSLRDPYSRTAPTSPDLENYNDIRPDILEMIKEEQKAKLLEPSQNWASHPGASSSSLPGGSYCYQNQLQSMWQKCWNQNASVYQVSLVTKYTIALLNLPMKLHFVLL